MKKKIEVFEEKMNSKLNQKSNTISNNERQKKKRQLQEYVEDLTSILIHITKQIEPYSMEFVRVSSIPLDDLLYRSKINIEKLISLSIELEDYRYLTNDKSLLDIRFISSEIGISEYGLLCKFLEKMHIRFIHHPDTTFLNLVKYKSDNSPLKSKIHRLEYEKNVLLNMS